MDMKASPENVDGKWALASGTRFRQLWRRHALFLSVVVLPTFLATLYFGLIASDVYVSESRFLVTSPERQAAPGLGMLLKGVGFSAATEEVYAVRDYAQSRDALQALNQQQAVSRAFGSSGVDIFNRFGVLGFDDSFEALYRYFKNKVRVEHDTSSSITTLTVRAYTARDAYLFNRKLLDQSERLVNRLNARARKDLITFAANELEMAQQRAQASALALSSYRNTKGVVDPERQAPVQLQLVSKLQDDLIATRTQIAQLKVVAPENPQLAALTARAGSLQQQIETETAKIAGGSQSLAGTAARYQRLSLDSQFADRQLASAMTAYEDARNEARRKQVYLSRIVEPNYPDIAIEPRRIRGILATFMLGIVAWGILSLLLAGVREHQG